MTASASSSKPENKPVIESKSVRRSSRQSKGRPKTKDVNADRRNPQKLKMKVKLKLPSEKVEKTKASREKPKPRSSTPKTSQTRKLKKASSTRSTSSLPSSSNPQHTKKAKKSQDDDLMCPTCDKTFLARSIYERHLKTYKHGIYSHDDHDLTPHIPNYLPHLGDRSLPHLNTVLQPKMEVGGREVNKYECHLCNKVFLRVKDLAKHREKSCSAWLSASM